VRIPPIQTGTVAVRTRQREGVGRGPLRLVNTLRDPDWTEPLPILAWVIEHPEGLIVVDTGETALTASKGYFPAWHPYYRRGVREWVRPEQEIGPQLERCGFSTRDVRWVVLTHMHTDHAGGLGHFRHSEIVVSRDELRHASGIAGKVRGYLPHRWPRWFAPVTVDFPDRPENGNLATRPLTAAGDVVLLATPGHTPGHMSVAIDLDGELVILAGDASYTERLMLDGAADGVTNQPRIAVDTLHRLASLVRSRGAVYLPSHDPDSTRRLDEMYEFDAQRAR
jgi:N-acyl homoserine lactone hydrolase